MKRERVISKHCPRDRLPTNVFNRPENEISTGGKFGFQQSLSNIKNLLSNITFSLTIINQGHGKYSLATSVWTLFDFFCPWDIIWWNIYRITNCIEKQMKWSIDRFWYQIRAKISLVMEHSALHFVQHSPRGKFLHIYTLWPY